MKYIKFYEDFTSNSGIIRARSSVMPLKYRKAMQILTEDESIDYIIRNCSEFIHRPTLIYRYIGQSEPYFRSEPIKRVSRDCPNWYTILLDNFKNWKKYPKRSKSFISLIGGSDESPDDIYYLVIPENGSKWGIAPSDDIYDCFSNTIGTPDNFFYSMNDVSTNLKLGGISDDSFKKMKKDIDKLDNALFSGKWKNFLDFESDYNYLGIRNNEPFFKYLDRFWKRNILEQLEILMDPIKNGFKLYDYKEIKYQALQCECWTDSPCVFVKMKEVPDLMDKLYARLDSYDRKIGKNWTFER